MVAFWHCLMKSLIPSQVACQLATIFPNTLRTFTWHISTIGWKKPRAWSIIGDMPMILWFLHRTRKFCIPCCMIFVRTCATILNWKSNAITKSFPWIHAGLISWGMCSIIPTPFCESQSSKNYVAGWQSWTNARLRRQKSSTNNKFVHGGDGASIVIQSI